MRRLAQIGAVIGERSQASSRRFSLKRISSGFFITLRSIQNDSVPYARCPKASSALADEMCVTRIIFSLYVI